VDLSPDLVIVGSGMGGASLAAGLAPSGAQVVILERGRHIPRDAPARDPNRIFRNSAFRSPETWLDEKGRPFEPGNYYHVGGNSKLYGAVLIRYRAEDFKVMQHLEGVSPAWPFPYETLAPWYERAERLYEVRGDGTDDPTEPPRGPLSAPAGAGRARHRRRPRAAEARRRAPVLAPARRRHRAVARGRSHHLGRLPGPPLREDGTPRAAASPLRSPTRTCRW
jgi:choline dehydrogenase-like flavoprotein